MADAVDDALNTGRHLLLQAGTGTGKAPRYLAPTLGRVAGPAARNPARHLRLQAGTGTGKSLGYLAPTLVRLAGSRERIVIATATLALQSQLADNDIPAALDAVQKVTGKRPKHAVLKGR